MNMNFVNKQNICRASASLAESRHGRRSPALQQRIQVANASAARTCQSGSDLNLERNMKIKSIITIAAIALLPLAGFAQPPQTPQSPQPPQTPNAPMSPDRHDKTPKVPVIFLGVETSTVPSVVADQLGLAKGFGLVVDYVVPDGPAAAAGVQQNDILKMLNDQILLEPGQLRKLLQTFQEGTTVTLTILRKGQEQKISVKLVKKEVRGRRDGGMPGHHDFGSNFDSGDLEGMDFGNVDLGDLKERLQDMKEHLKEQIGDQREVIHDAVMKANEEVRRARDEMRRNGTVNVFSSDNGALKKTSIDIGKAQIVFSDDRGELKLETVDGKKLLTAKDPQGKLLFSGPVETKEDLDKVPTDVRQRFNKLQENDLPNVGASEEDNDMDEDDSGRAVEQVNFCPRTVWMFGTLV